MMLSCSHRSRLSTSFSSRSATILEVPYNKYVGKRQTYIEVRDLRYVKLFLTEYRNKYRMGDETLARPTTITGRKRNRTIRLCGE